MISAFLGFGTKFLRGEWTNGSLTDLEAISSLFSLQADFESTGKMTVPLYEHGGLASTVLTHRSCRVQSFGSALDWDIPALERWDLGFA